MLYDITIDYHERYDGSAIRKMTVIEEQELDRVASMWAVVQHRFRCLSPEDAGIVQLFFDARITIADISDIHGRPEIEIGGVIEAFAVGVLSDCPTLQEKLSPLSSEGRSGATVSTAIARQVVESSHTPESALAILRESIGMGIRVGLPVPRSAPVATTAALAVWPHKNETAANDESHTSGNTVTRCKQSLDALVVGRTNRRAYSAARTVVREQKSPFNPLLIHGGPGVGKTHVLQGICNDVVQVRPHTKWLCLPAEEFANRFAMASKADELDTFRARMSRTDLLAIDDVHLLAGKPSIQEELLHTLDTINLAGKQVILVSDAHPKMIGQLSEKLVNHFVSGMVVEIDPPDLQMRCEICRQLALRIATSIFGEGMAPGAANLPESVIRFVAQRVCTNLHDLEGAILKLVVYAGLQNRSVTLAMAQSILDDRIVRYVPVVHFLDTMSIWAAHFDTIAADLHSAKKDHRISLSRLSMYLTGKPGYDLLAHASRDAIPLIGNDNELGILKRLWQETTRGMPRVIWIDGIPGIGKSRLLTEFLSLLRAVGGIHILTFQCWPFHKTTAYHPIIEMIRDYLYRLGTDKPAVVEQAVRVGATRWGIEDEQMIRTVISLLCPGPVSSPDDDVVSEGQVFEWTEGASIRKEMPDTFYRVLCMLSNDKPVVMAVENLEWADPSTRELLRHLVDRLSTEGQRQRILLLSTSRRAFRDELDTASTIEHCLHLHELNDKQAEELAKAAAKSVDTTLEPAVLERAVKDCGGIPQAILETVQVDLTQESLFKKVL